MAGLRETDAAWTILGRPKRSRSIKIEATRKLPSRLPARAFADGVVDVLTEVKQGAETADDLFSKLPAELRERLQPMLDETGADLVALKARLEQWFDDSMRGLEEMYQKWSKKLLFIVGLLLTLTLNASAVHIARRLWTSTAERAAVVAAVDDLVPDATAPGVDAPETATSFAEIADQITELDAIGLPLGWGDIDVTASWIALSAIGWLITVLLVRLGAPFWYDTLSRLFAMRKGLGGTAAADPASATTQIADETRNGERSAYDQPVSERSLDTPETNPAAQLFAALPTHG